MELNDRISYANRAPDGIVLTFFMLDETARQKIRDREIMNDT